MKMLNEEHHPNWYTDIADMKTLILGSFPPHADRWTYPFYYPNAQNRFWNILSEISGIPLRHTRTDKDKAVKERVEIMKCLHVGVQNIGLKIQRQGKSARDTDIAIVEFQDILFIIQKHKSLNRILLPGFSAPNSTFWSFMRYLSKHHIDVPAKIKPTPGFTFQIRVKDRIIECVVLNSTSTATKIPYTTILEQFRKYIL